MMVGLLQSPAVEEEPEEEGKGAANFESEFDSKQQLSTLSDPLGLRLPDLGDTSLSFIDSLLNFEYIDGLLAGGDRDFFASMDELGTSKGDGIEGLLGAKEVKLEKEMGQLVERSGELRNTKEFSGIGVAGGVGADSDSPEGGLGCLIEERLGNVKLEGESDCLVPVVSSGNDSNVRSDVGLISGGDGSRSHKMVGGDDTGLISGIVDCGSVDPKREGTVRDEDGGSSDMESESESSSELLSGDSDVEEKAENAKAEKSGEDGVDVEEGEIMLSDADEMVGWSDNDDPENDGVRGPIKSKNELEVLPPVPPVTVMLEPHHQTLSVGTILSILGPQVIVEGVEKHNPLSEGSILWISDTRSVLGIVDEIFGPVKNPYYIVRYNSESEVPSGIQHGTPISFVPEFASHVLNDKSLYQKGYDASGENDEELFDEMEFSDDEEEAEYRRMLKMKKRGMNMSKPGNKQKDQRRSNNRSGNWNRISISEDQQLLVSSIAISPGLGQDMPGNRREDKGQQNHRTGNWNRNKDPAASGDNPPAAEDKPHLAPSMSGNQPIAPPFWPRAQAPGFPVSSGVWNGGFLPLGPQSAGFPGGMPSNGMQWMQQNHPCQLPQAPMPTGVPFQQQMSTFPQFMFNFGQPSFGGGPALGPWPVPQFGFGFQAPGASLPQSGGSKGASQQQQPPPPPQPQPQPQGSQVPFTSRDSPANSGTAWSFSQGRGGGRGQHRGRGRGRFHSR